VASCYTLKFFFCAFKVTLGPLGLVRSYVTLAIPEPISRLLVGVCLYEDTRQPSAVFGIAVSKQAGDQKFTEILTDQALGETQKIKKNNSDMSSFYFLYFDVYLLITFYTW
jgi:hypothetical protein